MPWEILHYKISREKFWFWFRIFLLRSYNEFVEWIFEVWDCIFISFEDPLFHQIYSFKCTYSSYPVFSQLVINFPKCANFFSFSLLVFPPFYWPLLKLFAVFLMLFLSCHYLKLSNKSISLFPSYFIHCL